MAHRGKGSGAAAAQSDRAAPPAATFRLAALGRFRLEGPNGPVDLGSKKLCALLAFVACEASRPQSRETLTTLLWGSHFEAQARQNLRQALSRVRRALGDGILHSDDDTISIRPGAISCDVGQFEALIRDGGPEALTAAVDLYQGRFLANISIPEESWQEWVDAQRHRLEGLAVDAMVSLAETEAKRGDPARALALATRAVAIDGLREDAHRVIIRSLASIGRRAEAFKHYDQLAGRLKRELNVDPDVATVALVAELRKVPHARSAPAEPAAAHRSAADPVGTRETAPSSVTAFSVAARDDATAERDPSAEIRPRNGNARTAVGARPERRQVSVLFCDLVGSTSLSLRLDPEEFATVIGRYRRAAMKVVEALGGHVATFLGDGVMAIFGWPESHEDDAERALRAGLQLIDVIAAVPSAADRRLSARVGVSTGLVVIGGDTDDLGDGGIAGLTPNLAGRLQAEAEPGTLVVTPMTARLAGKDFAYKSLGKRSIKGLDEPIELLQVIGVAAGPSRFEAQRARSEAPLIGRAEELELLLSRWRRACDGEGQIVLLSGDAGIGKSRLVHTLYERVKPSAIVLRYQCSPLHRDDALYPVGQRLQRVAKITTQDVLPDKLAKLEAVLRHMGVEPAEHLPAMCHLLQIESKAHRLPDVGPQQLRERLVASLWTQVRSLAASGPILSIVEDAQWIDPTSEALLLRTLGEIEHLPIMVVVTNRDSYPPSWRSHDYTTLLGLERLGASDSRRLIHAIAGDRLSDATQIKIATRAGGVPLFLEELTLSLLEPGTTGSDGSRSDVPANLQALLATRLEKMGEAKRLVQVGAVLGRQFAPADVREMAGCTEGELAAMIDQALMSGLLQQRSDADTTLVFKHALVHDAAYASLLNSDKKRLHRAALQLLETRTDAAQGGGAAVLALHAERGEVWDKAALHLIASCRHAIRTSANHEAVALFERTLRALEHLPAATAVPLAIDIRLYAFSPLLALGETDRQVQILREAEALADGLGDKRRMAATASQLANALWLAGDHQAGLRSVDKAERLASELDDFVLRLSTRFNHANLFHATGRVREAAELYAAIARDLPGELELKRFGWPGPPSVLARSMLSWSLVWLGDFPGALQNATRAGEIAHKLRDLYSIVYAQMAMGLHHAGLGESDDAITAFEAAHAANREADMVLPIALAWLGAAYAQGGRAAEALPLLLDAERSGAYKAGGKYNWIHHYMALAQTHLALRDLEAARAAIGRAQDIAETAGELIHLAWSLKLRGDIEAAGTATAIPSAQDSYRRALTLAEPRGLRPLAAHCLAGLAATCMKDGQTKAAAVHRGKADAIFEALGMTNWLGARASLRKRAG